MLLRLWRIHKSIKANIRVVALGKHALHGMSVQTIKTSHYTYRLLEHHTKVHVLRYYWIKVDGWKSQEPDMVESIARKLVFVERWWLLQSREFVERWLLQSREWQTERCLHQQSSFWNMWEQLVYQVETAEAEWKQGPFCFWSKYR